MANVGLHHSRSRSEVAKATGLSVTEQRELGFDSRLNSLDDITFIEPDTLVTATSGKGANSNSDEALGQRRCELAQQPVILRVRHLSKSYPIEGTDERVVALKDIHLCEPEEADGRGGAGTAAAIVGTTFGPVRRGEFVMIRGPSGGGKTTLLNIIGTIDSCTNGSVELLDEVIDAKTKEWHLADVRLRTLGFVFQTFNLISTMTAAENVELPMTLMGKLSDSQIRLRARQLLALVGLRNRVSHLPSELSGGEQQRVTIARSLANNPALLLLDEPTGDLDTLNTIDIMDLLIRINRSTRTTCIMVTHNPDIECYADRILYVADGRFVREVWNDQPSCLDPDAYARYLEEKEREITQTKHWNQVGAAEEEGGRSGHSGDPRSQNSNDSGAPTGVQPLLLNSPRKGREISTGSCRPSEVETQPCEVCKNSTVM